MFALAILVFYIPILVVLIYAARSLRRNLITSANDAPISPRTSKIAIAAGTIVATALTLLVAYLVPLKGNDWNAFFFRIAVTLIVPFVVGFLFVLLARLWPSGWGGVPGSVVVNRLGIGAFHGIWFFPVFLFVSIQVLTVLESIVKGSWRW